MLTASSPGRYQLFSWPKTVWNCVFLVTFGGINHWAYVFIFFLIDRRDEYQLVQYITNFKVIQFVFSGCVPLIWLLAKTFECLQELHLHARDDGECAALASYRYEGFQAVTFDPRAMRVEWHHIDADAWTFVVTTLRGASEVAVRAAPPPPSHSTRPCQRRTSAAAAHHFPVGRVPPAALVVRRARARHGVRVHPIW